MYVCLGAIHVYWVCVLPRHALEVHIECPCYSMVHTHARVCVYNSWSPNVGTCADWR